LKKHGAFETLGSDHPVIQCLSHPRQMESIHTALEKSKLTQQFCLFMWLRNKKWGMQPM